MSRFEKLIDSFRKGVKEMSRFEKISITLGLMNVIFVALALL